jgi:hypothetical protein
MYLDALILDTEPVVLHRGGVSKYLKSVEDRRHESFSCHEWFEVDSPVFDYEILELSQRESWNNLIEHQVPTLTTNTTEAKIFVMVSRSIIRQNLFLGQGTSMSQLMSIVYG